MSVYRACCESDLETVQRLVPAGATLGARHRALCAACEAGYPPAIEYLLRLGTPRQHQGQSALVAASAAGELIAVRYLVAVGEGLEVDGLPALVAAAGEGHLSVVRYLVERGVNPDGEEGAALESAATGHRAGVIRYLIRQGADYRAGEDRLFIQACRERYRWLIRYLVGLGVDWHARDDQAFLTACERGDRRVVRYLGGLGSATDLLFLQGAERAVYQDRPAIFRYLVRLADGRFKDWGFVFRLAFSLACTRGQLETVQCLIAAGYDYSDRGLWSAVKGGNLELVEYLIGLGLRDPDSSALVEAVVRGRLDLVRLLVERGGADGTNLPAFWAACEGGHLAIIQYLVGQGADHQAEGDRGFHLACEERHEDAVRYLLNLGVHEETLARDVEDPWLGVLVHARQVKSARSAV